ncbi:Bidirectional sugar transporter SWEET7 [Forsythia ovata]|uniref:Bidirectional sugar transporter SWEET n=1 Tax=Forsythia ovata TaxID=205694 RepID=A0ABD1UFL0_9LAMI
MTHRAEALARTIIGIIGNIISFSLFISPTPTFWRIIQKKSTEEFHPYPYLASVMNCVFWIFYGIPVVHPDSVLVVTINSIGLALELIYLCIFFIFTNKKNRITILLFLVSEIVFLAVIATITLLCFHTHETRSMFVGIICDIFGIIMYASPLSIVRKVFKTKSVEFLPFWLCLAGFANGVVWFTYAFLKTFDPYIATGNGIGAILGFIQLCVYINFSCCRKTTLEGVKPSEVQLQKTEPDWTPSAPPINQLYGEANAIDGNDKKVIGMNHGNTID